MVALNTLSTLCTFLCFSSKNLLNQLISRGQIDRQLKNFDDNALSKDQKYLCAVEARAVACRAFIDNAPQLVSNTSVPVIQTFLQWVLPNTSRTDFKNAAIYLLKCVYNFDEKMPQWCAKTLNKCVPNATLLKTIAQELIQEDTNQGRAPQIQFVEGNRLDKNDNPRIICLAEAREDDQVNMDFPPGTCQFCAREIETDPAKIAEKMWVHLMEECPCCCCCPACH